MKWINFLHIYQPPTQTAEILKLVTEESYLKIIELVETYPNLKITLNISGSLIELWDNHGYKSLIERFRKQIEAGKIELVGSAMYHPILPLLDEVEVVRQVELHNEICKKHFGTTYRPTGFFLPEMAYSKKVGIILKDLGFSWLILDEIHFPDRKPNSHIKYTIKESGLKVVFRNRLISKMFPPEWVVTHLSEIKQSYLVTAHDGELYGHWHKHDNGFYKKAFSNPTISFLTVSEYLVELYTTETISAREASWESEDTELTEKVPYSLWADPKNPIHKKLEKFKKDVLQTIKTHASDNEYKKARTHLDKGLASCAWWWASGKKLTPVSAVSWNPTEIERGLKELLLAIRALSDIPAKTKISFEKKSAEISSLVWSIHWNKAK